MENIGETLQRLQTALEEQERTLSGDVLDLKETLESKKERLSYLRGRIFEVKEILQYVTNTQANGAQDADTSTGRDASPTETG